MVKTAELQIIKLAAFEDEFVKIAGVGLAAKLLTKALPKLMMNVAKMFGSAGGKNMVAGRGAAGGAYKFLRGAGKKGWGASKTLGVGNKLIARNLGVNGGRMQNFNPIYKNRKANAVKGSGTTARPEIPVPGTGKAIPTGTTKSSIGKAKKQKMRKDKDGNLTDTPLYGKFFGEGSNKIDWLKNRPKAWLGEASENIAFMQRHGVGGYAKNQMRQAKTFTKNIGAKEVKTGKKTIFGNEKTKMVGGTEHIFERGMLGKTINPIMSTGVGMGGLGFALNKTDARGKKVGLAKRTAGGVGEAALWSIAPGAAGAHLLGSMAPDGARLLKGLVSG